MKSTILRWSLVLMLVVLMGTFSVTVAGSPAVAHAPLSSPIPITADQAFDAVTRQIDPGTGMSASIALVDVRDPVEILFSGAPAAVDEISLPDGGAIEPDWGKVRLIEGGKFVEYRIDGQYRRMQVAKIGSLEMSQIAVNIPYWLWTSPYSYPVPNPNFADDVEALADSYDVVILFCRTGGRAWLSTGDFDTELFDAVYLIDDPTAPGQQLGGFSGSGYGNVYNGYAGFPGRLTDIKALPLLASWMDAGLPIVTMRPPETP